MFFKFPTAYQSSLIKFIKISVQETRLLLTIILITISVVSSEGQTYKEVKIGNQIWMADNLNIFYFRNGDAIPIAKSLDEWMAAGKKRQPACCFYSNNGEEGEKYGVLYNWYAVRDSRGLAPIGWHIPCSDEWSILFKQLGGFDKACIELKSESGWPKYLGDLDCINCKLWPQSKKAGSVCAICNDTRKVLGQKSSAGINSSGFSALPGGIRAWDGSFYSKGDIGFWWVCDEVDTSLAKYISMRFDNDPIYIHHRQKLEGLSVRCLKD